MKNFDDWKIVQFDEKVMQLRYQWRGLGWFLLILGLFFLFLSLPFIPSAMSMINEAGMVFIVFIIGGASAIAGLRFILSEGETVIDREAGTITMTWRSPLSSRREVQNIGRVREVDFLLEWKEDPLNRSKTGLARKIMNWVVYVETEGGEKIRFFKSLAEPYGRKKSEQLSRFFGVPLRDATGEQETVRMPMELDRSLLSGHSGVTPDLSSLKTPPLGSGIAVEQREDEISFMVPHSAIVWFMKMFLFIWSAGMFFASLYAVPFLIGNYFHNPDFTAAAFVEIFAALGFTGALIVSGYTLYITSKAFFKDEIRITSDRIEHHFWGLLGRRGGASMPLDKVEEIKLASYSGSPPESSGQQSLFKAPGLAIKSDDCTIALGRGLDERRLEWLCDAFTKALLEMHRRKKS